MIRQGDLTLMEHYDEAEGKLTLFLNKPVMAHEAVEATLLIEELSADAHHGFILGLQRSLKANVFSTCPKGVASASALAREAEASIQCSVFSDSYAKAIAEKK